MVGKSDCIIERVRTRESGIAIEGEFELPLLARLSDEDQVFVAMFVKTHGSIKEMESLFGVSYPTIKNRLNRIAQMLEVVEVSRVVASDDILGQLERGEISAEDAARKLRKE
jgi:hypothetical protein